MTDQIVDHCRQVHFYCLHGDTDLAIHHMQMALVKWQGRQFNRMVDNLQRTLNGETDVAPLFPVAS